MTLAFRELTGKVIGAAIEVHAVLGPGFLESLYAQALALELRARGVAFERELVVPVRYRGQEIGCHRLDLLVEGRVVVELKAARDLETVHFAVVRSYLKATGCEHGLLLNFARPTLQVRRVGVRSGYGVGSPART